MRPLWLWVAKSKATLEKVSWPKPTSTWLLVFLVPVLVRWGTALVSIAQAADPAQAAFEAAKALGAASAQTQAAGVRDGTAVQSTVAKVVPGYTATPVQAQIYSSKNLTGAGAAQKAQCQATPRDPVCSAIAIGAAPRPASTLTPASPVFAADAAAANPTAVLGDVAGTYSGCAVSGKLTSRDQYQRRWCAIDVDGWSDQTCTKTLSVHPVTTTSCTTGSVLASQVLYRGGRPGSDFMSFSATCSPMTNRNIPFSFDAQGGHGACEAPLSVVIPFGDAPPSPNADPQLVASLSPNWSGGCMGLSVYVEGAYCQGGSCNATLHFAQEPAWQWAYSCSAPSLTGDQIAFATWQAPADAQARCYAPQEPPPDSQPTGVPGAAVPDPGGGLGVPLDPALAQQWPTPMFWAESGIATRTRAWSTFEHYTAGVRVVEPRLFPAVGPSWASSCAVLEAQTSNLPPDGVSTSAQALPAVRDVGVGQCVRTSSVCSDPGGTRVIDGVPVAADCWGYTNQFSCTALNAQSTCGDPSLAACSPAGTSCSQADGLGHCLQAQVGYDCKVASAAFAPALNCGSASFCSGGSCWDTKSTPNTGFAQTVSTLEATVEAGKDFDTTNMEIFKGADRRCRNGEFGLDNCCSGSALLKQCSADDQQLRQLKDAGKCHEIGTYCSSKNFLLGCTAKKTTSCCFSSLLARLVQEQGRAQLNRGWGDPESPVCNGFTPDELTQLDWSTFDLSEYFATIAPAPAPTVDAVTGSANTKQPSCYYGEGRC